MLGRDVIEGARAPLHNALVCAFEQVQCDQVGEDGLSGAGRYLGGGENVLDSAQAEVCDQFVDAAAMVADGRPGGVYGFDAYSFGVDRIGGHDVLHGQRVVVGFLLLMLAGQHDGCAGLVADFGQYLPHRGIAQ
ncbi:Uncharacterised protein [Mycobacteroides abscessus subsp. massiliense]|nr:Uncharacterised protein [Mycobacteroides abscessus subsp. massiliense]